LKNLRYTSGDSIKKRYYWESVIIVYEAWVHWAERYADLADKTAAQTTHPARKAELLDMARMCRKVPRKPAETFKEAVQSFWLTFLLACPSPTTSAGRFDQYMYPFYIRDISDGRITRDEALEWLEILRCKVMKINRVSGKANRAKNSGMAKWYNWTIGGMRADGTDATNDVSYLLLEAAKETQLPHYTLTVRVYDKTPPELLQKALEVVRTGLGLPAFLGDKSYIKFFTMNGVPVEDARDYCATGCVDGNIPAVTRTQVVIFFVIAQAFDIFMHNGYCRYTKEMVGINTGDITDMQTFEQFKDAFYTQFEYLIGLAAERNNVEQISQQELFPDPFRSALMRDGVKTGKDLLDRRFEFENSSILGAVGGVNVGDSLMAIKKLIFDKKKYTMAELLTALDADWEGYNDMRRDFLSEPKYGNDIDEVDLLVAEIYQKFSDFCYSQTNAYGGSVVPNAISISAHQPGGACTGATPDGRKGGEILADASLSPNHGMDKKGPLAVIKSAMKINADPYQGMLHNMKFHPSALKTDEDLMKLGVTIKTYLTNGGKHIQFNVVNREEMIEAKTCPDQHSDLVVRVAGYSAYFTRLTPQIQDEVINRTSFENI
jgi:formate C-acetyltransferase